MDEREKYVPPYWVAVVHAGLGAQDSAFRWLERAYEAHDGSLVFLKVEPALDPLRGDLRFAALVKKMGLDDSNP